MKSHMFSGSRCILAVASLLFVGVGHPPASAQSAPDWAVVTPPLPLGALQETPVMAADASGGLYVAEASRFQSRIQRRDAQGNWSLVAGPGAGLGQVIYPTSLALGGDGSLYVAETGYHDDRRDLIARIQKRDPQGNWSLIASYGTGLGQVLNPAHIAVDGQGNLFVAESNPGGARTFSVQKRDPQGNWTAVDEYNPLGSGPAARFTYISGMAADADGFVYVATGQQVQMRHPIGGWAVIAGERSNNPEIDVALHVSAAGKEVFVTRSGQSRSCSDSCPAVYRFSRTGDAQGEWSVLLRERAEVQSVGSLAASPSGGLFLLDSGKVRRRNPDGVWEDIMGWESRPGYYNEHTQPKLAADAQGSRYALEFCPSTVCTGRFLHVQKWDAAGNASFLDIPESFPVAMGHSYFITSDPNGVLYLAGWAAVDETGPYGSVVYRRGLNGSWERIAEEGRGLGQVYAPNDVTTDSAGNLYVLENARVQRRTPAGVWSEIPLTGPGWGNFVAQYLAVDDAGALYYGGTTFVVGEGYAMAVLKRNPDGTVTPLSLRGAGQTTGPLVRLGDLAVDANGNLYALDMPISYLDGVDKGSRLFRYNTQGGWTVLAAEGSEPGQVYQPTGGLAVAGGALYVGDNGNRRIQRLALPAVMGDVDENNALDVRDVILSLQFSIGLAAPQTERQRQAADVNFDTRLTVSDSVWILQRIVGLTSR